MVARIGPPDRSLGRLGRYAAHISKRLVRLLVTFLPSPLTTVSVGSAAKGEKESTDEREHLEALKAALLRLPKVHLFVLDAIVLHLKTLVPSFLYHLREPHFVY
jgi:hypothetical protein